MSNRNPWRGKTWFCPNCGSPLIEEEKKELYEDDFPSFKEYEEYLDNQKDSFNYHCSSDQCYYHLESFYTLFHPLRGIDSCPGDSWAIGFVK